MARLTGNHDTCAPAKSQRPCARSKRPGTSLLPDRRRFAPGSGLQPDGPDGAGPSTVRWRDGLCPVRCNPPSQPTGPVRYVRTLTAGRHRTVHIIRQDRRGLTARTCARTRRCCRIGVAPFLVPACGLPGRCQESQRESASPPVTTLIRAPTGRLGPFRLHTLSWPSDPARRTADLCGSEPP